MFYSISLYILLARIKVSKIVVIVSDILENIYFFGPSILVFIFMLTLLVIAHELGHFWFARLMGMKVEEFAVGFGKPCFPIFKKNGTLFTIRAWLLGGFVKIHGMEPMDDGSEIQVKDGFYSKTPLARLLVLFAGPLFSILFGYFVLVGYFFYQGEVLPSQDNKLGYVGANTPAEKAGLQEGDVILKINDTEIEKYIDIIKITRTHAGKLLKVSAIRKGDIFHTEITPQLDPTPTPVISDNLELTDKLMQQGKIGAMWSVVHRKISLSDAFIKGYVETARGAYMFAKVFTSFQKAKENLGGLGSIAAITHQATQQGIDKVVYLSAMISLSLGFMNLLPIFPLDGGQMVVAFIELCRGGRRLSMKVQNIVATAGFGLLFLLIAGSLWNDVERFSSGIFSSKKPNVVKKD